MNPPEKSFGLAAIMARASGVTKTIGADVHDNRLELANGFGATHTVNWRTRTVSSGNARS